MTDAWNMELNKIANEIVNEYIAREPELKEEYYKFPSALHHLVQTIFPTEAAAGLLEGLPPARRWQAAAVILSSRRRRLSAPEEPAAAEGGEAGMRKEILFASAW